MATVRATLGGAWTRESRSPGGAIETTALFLPASELYYGYDKVVGAP